MRMGMSMGMGMDYSVELPPTNKASELTSNVNTEQEQRQISTKGRRKGNQP